jgi:hypothetical protein
VDWLLAIKVTQDMEKGTISIDQSTYVQMLADKFLPDDNGIRNKLVETPMLHTAELPRLKEREVPKSEFDYLSFVACCLHLVNCARPDIATAVGILARHANARGKLHVKACRHLMHYLWCTRNLGITYYRHAKDYPVNTAVHFANAAHPLDPNKEQMPPTQTRLPVVLH